MPKYTVKPNQMIWFREATDGLPSILQTLLKWYSKHAMTCVL